MRTPLPRSPRARDLSVAVLVTAVAELELLLTADRVEGSLAGHLLLNVFILPALALRRRHPLGAALVGAASLALQPFAGEAPVAAGFLVLLFVLASLGWYADTRHGLAGLAAVVLAGLTFELSEGLLLADLVVNVVLLVAAWAVGRGLRVTTDRRVTAEIGADRAARVAVQEERGRISRDLHDSLAHALTLITLQAGSARERVDDPLASSTLGTIEETGRQALADMQGFLRLLVEPAAETPGVEHLEDLAEGVRRHGVTVSVDARPGPLSPGVSAVVYRVVQEGLTNVVRHSQADSVEIMVTRRDGSLVARVSSTGRPRPAATVGTGRGLVGLRERLSLVGGRLESAATTDGWRLEATIPAPEEMS